VAFAGRFLRHPHSQFTMLSRGRRRGTPAVRTIRIQIGSHGEVFHLRLESLTHRHDSIRRVSLLRGIAQQLVDGSKIPAPPPSHEQDSTVPPFDFDHVPIDFQCLEDGLPIPSVNDWSMSDPSEFTNWLQDVSAESWAVPAPWTPATDQD
jgi:hypothetical protein